ncbi:MAG TPA: glycosyltransferase family 1 protein [Anaerolineae bacterium]|nr:glycosyltransferase family 1 protein [Anaerolineae bacterium]
MKVAIDYTAAARQRAGIGRYTRSLIHALAQQDQTNSYTLYVPSDARYLDDAHTFPNNFRIKRAPLNERAMVTLWQRARIPLPIEVFTGESDVFYSPDFVLPPTRAKRKILTVHDLSFKRVPETVVPNLKWYLEGAVPRAVQRADLILADSEATRKDLIELFHAPSERVRTLYSGCDPLFQRVTDARELTRVREQYQLQRPFILNVGTIEPRKNLTRLVQAFAQLPPRGDLELVIAGGRGWMYDEIYAAPQKFGVSDAVRFLGFTPDADLPALYSLSEIFVYPSLYEGFGLPVLEAMTCGTAIVTANNSSLPEVAGDAALLVDARNTEALVSAMHCLLEDTDLRKRMQEKALARAKLFSWEKSARELREAFEDK